MMEKDRWFLTIKSLQQLWDKAFVERKESGWNDYTLILKLTPSEEGITVLLQVIITTWDLGKFYLIDETILAKNSVDFFRFVHDRRDEVERSFARTVSSAQTLGRFLGIRVENIPDGWIVVPKDKE